MLDMDRGRKPMRRQEEVDVLEAADLLDLPPDTVGKLVEQEKLKSRRADGTVYFLRTQIEELGRRQLEELIPEGEL
jgi:hypothetical protein